MPPRSVIVIIVAFWLGTIGYLAYRDWLPWFSADSPPPFTVDLADEAAPQTAPWTIWRGDKKIGSLTTRMTYQKDDTFELVSAVEDLEITQSSLGVTAKIKVPKLNTTQHVTRQGRLLNVQSNLVMVLEGPGQKLEFRATVGGEVKDGMLHARCTLDSPFGQSRRSLEPIPLDSGSVLNPLQPVARLKVRPGQRWKITTVDPLGAAITATFQQMLGPHGGGDVSPLKVNVSPPKTLLAEVLSETKDLDYRGQRVACHVIQFRGTDDFAANTWIKADDGKVLLQEVSGYGEKLTLKRAD